MHIDDDDEVFQTRGHPHITYAREGKRLYVKAYSCARLGALFMSPFFNFVSFCVGTVGSREGGIWSK